MLSYMWWPSGETLPQTLIRFTPLQYSPFLLTLLLPSQNPLFTVWLQLFIIPFKLYLPIFQYIQPSFPFYNSILPNINLNYHLIHLIPIISTNLPLIIHSNLITSYKLTTFLITCLFSYSLYISSQLPSQLLLLTITHLHTITLSHSTCPYYSLQFTSSHSFF